MTNLLSGNAAQTRRVVESGAIPKLMDALSSPHDHCRDQVLWALGNAAGDSPDIRAMVIKAGAFQSITPLFQTAVDRFLAFEANQADRKQSAPCVCHDTVLQAMFTMTNLCRKPTPRMNQVMSSLRNKLVADVSIFLSLAGRYSADGGQALDTLPRCPDSQ